MDEGENNECSPNDSDEPSTTSYEIMRRLGPFSDPGFILANRKWLEKVGPDLSHLSLAMPISGYTFLIPDKGKTILGAQRGHFPVYKLAAESGLRFPLPHFVG